MISLIAVVSVLAMVLSLFGNLLMAKKNMLVFPVWITANILWIVVNIISTFNVPMVIMYCVYILMQLYSWREWKKDKKGDSY